MRPFPKTRAVSHRRFLVALALMPGCGPTEGERFRDLQREINALKVEKIQLEERLEKRDARITKLDAQIQNLRNNGGIPHEPVFGIDRIKILGITGGADTDQRLGDDAVVVYFRPIDIDGDTIKRAGEIEITLLDILADPKPEVLGHRVDNNPQRVRKLWYGKFWTNHYKVVVPFAPGAAIAPGQEVDVHVRFMETATGREFTDRKVIEISRVLPEE